MTEKKKEVGGSPKSGRSLEEAVAQLEGRLELETTKALAAAEEAAMWKTLAQNIMAQMAGERAAAEMARREAGARSA